MENTQATKDDLLDFARVNYASEIDELTAEYEADDSEPGTFAHLFNMPGVNRAAAEINVSRRHNPEAWKRLDEVRKADADAANADDM